MNTYPVSIQGTKDLQRILDQEYHSLNNPMNLELQNIHYELEKLGKIFSEFIKNLDS